MKRGVHQQSALSRSSLTIVNRTFLFLFILCFAGCAAGSCLSYGHSCWGAHGKRSYNSRRAQHDRPIDNNRDGSIITEVETDDGNVPALKQDRWILSRLITGRLTVPASAVLTVDERPDTGNRLYRTAEKVFTIPANWDTEYDSTNKQISRDQKVETNVMSNEDSKEFDDPYDITRKFIEPHAETTDLLIIPSRQEYEKHSNRARRLKLLKILTDSSDDKVK